MHLQSERLQTIREKLIHALEPSHLELLDDSAEHAGHAGSMDGAGHYTLVIDSPLFHGKSKVQMHQMVYEALKGMIGPDIHALRIVIHKT